MQKMFCRAGIVKIPTIVSVLLHETGASPLSFDSGNVVFTSSLQKIGG